MHSPPPEGILVPLLRQAVRGDEAAREELVAHLWVFLLPYVRKQARSRDDARDLAQDLAQDAMLRILRNLYRCQATVDAEVAAWALAIAHNVVLDDYRAHVRLELHRLSPELEALTYRFADGPYRPCEQYRPETILDALVRSTIRGLPADLRKLLELKILHDATWADVGEALGTTAAGAKRRFQRAQGTIQREILRRTEALPSKKRAIARACLRRLGVRE